MATIRPWLSIEQDFDYTLPSSRNYAQDPVVSILDPRQAPGRLPGRIDSLLSVPAQYFVVRKSGKTECLHQRELKCKSKRRLLLDFERTYPQFVDKKCEGGKAYPGIERVEGADSSEEPRSPDELYIPEDTMWEFELHQFFHEVY
jgi:hypothetical protein